VKIFNFSCPAGFVLTILFCVVLLPPLIVHSEAGTETPSAETADPEAKKIHISAERLISNTADNHAEFIGNVRAKQGKTLIIADSLKLFFFRWLRS